MGAVVGAVLGGAGASLEASGSTTYNPPGGNGNGTSHTIDFSTFIVNAGNTHDNVGSQHYESINSYLQTADQNSSVDDFYTHCASSMSQTYGSTNVDIYTLQSYQDDITFTQLLDPNAPLSVAVEDLHSLGEISTTVRDILVPYFDSFDAVPANDVIGFVNYSISAEDLVSNDPSIVDLDKQFILGTMATARYGIQYWDHFTF